MTSYPNKLKLQHDGRLVMSDGSSVEAYLAEFANAVNIKKGKPMPVIVQCRKTAQRIYDVSMFALAS